MKAICFKGAAKPMMDLMDTRKRQALCARDAALGSGCLLVWFMRFVGVLATKAQGQQQDGPGFFTAYVGLLLFSPRMCMPPVHATKNTPCHQAHALPPSTNALQA
eukprot:1147856-Pelagomonas_calceolata.AAC.2